MVGIVVSENEPIDRAIKRFKKKYERSGVLKEFKERAYFTKPSVKKRMKAALKDIQSGKFARNWVKEYETGYKRYNALLKKGAEHPIEKTGERLRSMMPWMKKRSIKGAQAAY